MHFLAPRLVTEVTSYLLRDAVTERRRLEEPLTGDIGLALREGARAVAARKQRLAPLRALGRAHHQPEVALLLGDEVSGVEEPPLPLKRSASFRCAALITLCRLGLSVPPA